jgi:hypothetical protein
MDSFPRLTGLPGCVLRALALRGTRIDAVGGPGGLGTRLALID